MLPFLKPKQVAGIIISHRKSDKPKEKTQEYPGLAEASTKLLAAIDERDIKKISEALKDAFLICDAQPHEEGEHTNDYDSQNELAAQSEE